MQSNCPSNEQFALIKFGDALILFIVSLLKSNLCLLFIGFKVKTGWFILKKDKLLAFLFVVAVLVLLIALPKSNLLLFCAMPHKLSAISCLIAP
jgi:hypothetical protein